MGTALAYVVERALALLVDHAPAVLFTYVFATQLGAPLPAAPLMMAAGALTATGRVALFPALAAIVVACLCADSVWYFVGRAGGDRLARALGRISRESAAWVRATEDAFAQYGARFVLFAKFLPVLSMTAAPIAGQSGMSFRRFLAYDAVSAVAWAVAHVLVGRLLLSFRWLGAERSLLAFVAIAVAVFFVSRVLRRRRLMGGTAKGRDP